MVGGEALALIGADKCPCELVVGLLLCLIVHGAEAGLDVEFECLFPFFVRLESGGSGAPVGWADLSFASGWPFSGI